MNIEYTTSLTLIDACHATGLESRHLFEIVEYGIITPQGDSPDDWRFDLHMISTAKRALRLQRDLHLEWSAIALVLELLDEREQLRRENAMLQQRLERFLCD
ncbi:MAG: chaperone modulator CbpM [Gammaproteobacteria bacterium]|nr:chaperone modulator CbpM [Gammaproteobacteria bacterium]MDP2142117.1 chaperone modulator CbpM [Gammaproteobacteria bacterium]MDP2348275.1 chaperone modulator CbpM [Gammaproteobacteria bacterium]